jgi:FkbM family methyltransferase
MSLPRPCACDAFVGPSRPWGPGNCHPCWLYHNDPAFRALWSGGPPAAVLAPCPDCGGKTRFKVGPGMDARNLARLLPGGRDGWPEDWVHWPVTAEAHRLAFAAALAAPPPPGDWSGRGIVTCAGGWRFLAGAYVLARVLRWLGWPHPIQAWYLGDHGEHDPCFDRVTAGLGVEWVDACAHAREHGVAVRRWGGWELKSYAVLHSPFREVLYLDADCYPVREPTYLFDHPAVRAAGALFFPDDGGAANGAPLEPGQWWRFGLADRREPDFESGQLLVDKSRCHRALHAVRWLNDHSDYVFRHVYGDKSTWHLGFRAAGADYRLAPPVRWHNVAFLQHDPDGAVQFVHRCRDKPRLGGNAFEYCTSQRSANMVRDDVLPHEWLVHEAVRDCEAMLFPTRLPAWRPGTQDEEIWREVWLLNAYGLPERFAPGSAVVDVGAHIGVFARACLDRGAAVVWCLEPDPDNFAHLARNLAGDPGARPLRAAAWAGSGGLRLRPAAPGRTGEPSVAADAPGPAVAAVDLDDVVRRAAADGGGRVRLLKLDCEGSEWPLLEGCREWGLVDEVVGEYHLHGTGRRPGDAAGMLARHGFETSWEPNPKEPALGTFRGVRRG